MRRAQVKVKMLTGSYILQSNRSKFNKYAVSDTCPLCKCASENLSHFLLECPSLQPVRADYILGIEKLLYEAVPDSAALVLADTGALCRVIMDCTVLGELSSCCPTGGCLGKSKR